MAYSFDVNNAAMTGAVAVFKLKELLKGQGWTVLGSSDGTTANLTSDIITTGASGAGGLANNQAWFRIQMPTMNSVTRELVFQKTLNGSNIQWSVKYSYSAGFVSGGNATVTPTASDQVNLRAAASIFNADNGYRFNACAGGAAEKYGFWAGAFPIGGGNASGGAICMFPLVAGTYPAEDIDPYFFYVPATSINSFHNDNFDDGGTVWLRKGMTGESFVVASACQYVTGATNPVFPGPATTTANPHSGLDDVIPMPIASVFYSTGRDHPGGYKGMVNMMMWNGAIRPTGDTISLSAPGAKDRIVYRDVNLPWNGSTPTV